MVGTCHDAPAAGVPDLFRSRHTARSPDFTSPGTPCCAGAASLIDSEPCVFPSRDPGACAMRRHREYPRCIGQGKDAPVLTCFRALRLRWPAALCTSSSFRAATPRIILSISALRLPLSQRGATELRQREAAKHARREEVRPFPTSWTNLPRGRWVNLQTMSLAGHP